MSGWPSLLVLALLCGRPYAAAAPQDTAALEAELRSDDAYKRGKAVEALIRDGSPAAWELVLDSLEDPAGRVADKAQLALANLPPGLRDELLGKRGLLSKKPLVALRVAELLGRMQPCFAGDEFAKALRHKDADVRRSLLWSVERLALADQLDESADKLSSVVRKLADKDRDVFVRAQALVTLGALAPALAREALPESSASKFTELRAAATELIAILEEQQRLPALRRALADETRLVRLRAFEVAAGLQSLAGLELLIGALETESETRLAWRLVDLLRTQSGMQYGRDARPWKLWLSGQAANWAPAKEGHREGLEEAGTSSLVGMPILSSRLSFLIDFSGSMWKEQGGKTRKQRVDEQLSRALAGLAPDAKFNIQPFSAQSLQWQKKLTVASPRNVKAALAYFKSCSLRGAGDYFPAMLQAMQDPELDTIMLLGDGAPSGGSRWDLELMKELFTHENRFRALMVDVLLVETKGRLLSYWESLCERSGGRCLTVKL